MGHSEIAPRKVPYGTFKSTKRMYDLINEVLASERISYGEKSMLFERQFADLHDCKYGILSNSGTSSLHVAVQALKELHGWDDGDEVIVPASTFVATINVVLHNNLTPVFVDIEPSTYGIDPLLISERVTERTRAIIPVHLYGQPCEMLSIMELATRHDLAIIEDSCEAAFVSCAGAKVGSMGQIGCFSTYNAHLICTGVGGMATTNDDAYAMKMRSLVNHGLDIAELNVDENFSPRPAVGRSFSFTHAGHSYRITELEAAMGLAQLETYPEMLKARRRNATHLTAVFEQINELYGWNVTIPRVALGNEHSWMMYPIVLDPGKIAKDELTGYLNRHYIETRDMMPIVNQPIYDDMIRRGEFPIAEWTCENGFYVGCHQDLQPEDIEYVRQVLTNYARMPR